MTATRTLQVQQTLVLPFTLPDVNELLAARGRRVGNGNEWAEWKARMQPVVAGLARRSLKPLRPGGIWLRFNWFEADERRDPLDVPGLAKKMIVDALCEPDRPGDKQDRAGGRASIIHCDGWHCIGGGTDHFAVDRDRPRIEVVLYGVRS